MSHAIRLGALERFAKLEKLYLESRRRGVDVIGRLTSLRRLPLRSITLSDIALLLPPRNLKELELKLGGTRNLALLPEIERLRFLEIGSRAASAGRAGRLSLAVRVRLTGQPWGAVS